MQQRRLALLLTALLILTLVLSACAARPGQGTLAANPTSEDLVVDLPAVVIDYDAQGTASLSGAGLTQLGTLLGQDLSMLDRSPEVIKALQDAGVQNVFVNISPEGLNIYANGDSLLSLAWTPEQLASLGDLLKSLKDPQMAQIADLLPVAASMSLGVVMNFPKAEGAEALPLVSDKAVDSKALIDEAKKAAPAALTALLPDNMKNMAGLMGGLLAGLPPLTVTFDANGAGTLQGLAPFILSQIPAGAIQLPADLLKTIQGYGIKTLNIKNSADGLNVSVNGKALPAIMWSKGEMKNLGSLGVKAGVLKAVANVDDSTLESVQKLVDAAPILQSAKLDVTVNFP